MIVVKRGYVMHGPLRHPDINQDPLHLVAEIAPRLPI